MYLFKIISSPPDEAWRTAVVQCYLDIFKAKVGSHFGCMYNTKTSVHSHNVSVVKNCARLVKDRLDFIYSALLLVSVV